MAPRQPDRALLWLAVIGCTLGGLAIGLLGAGDGGHAWSVVLVALAVAGVTLGLTRILRLRRPPRESRGPKATGTDSESGA